MLDRKSCERTTARLRCSLHWRIGSLLAWISKKRLVGWTSLAFSGSFFVITVMNLLPPREQWISWPAKELSAGQVKSCTTGIVKSADRMSCKRLGLKRLLLLERSPLNQFSFKPCGDSHPYVTANFHPSAVRHGSLRVQTARFTVSTAGYLEPPDTDSSRVRYWTGHLPCCHFYTVI
jgi:hypothetical protein